MGPNKWSSGTWKKTLTFLIFLTTLAVVADTLVALHYPSSAVLLVAGIQIPNILIASWFFGSLMTVCDPDRAIAVEDERKQIYQNLRRLNHHIRGSLNVISGHCRPEDMTPSAIAHVGTAVVTITEALRTAMEDEEPTSATENWISPSPMPTTK